LIQRPLTTANLQSDFFLGLIPYYLTSVYPVNPVITEAEVIQCIEKIPTSREAASFCYAFAAVTINLTRIDGSQEKDEQISSLLDRALGQMDPMGLQSKPTILKAMRSLFFEICLLNLHRNVLAFYYLRDAISMLQMLGATDTSHTSHTSHTSSQKQQLQRAYWECFVHERYTALTDYHPTCLAPLASLPEPDPSLDAGLEMGWNNIVRTFLLVDEPFISYWVGDRTRIPKEWFERKQVELDDDRWQVEVQLLTEMQQADLIITRQWLRTLTWQMALANLILSSDHQADGHPPVEALSLTMPLRLSRQLRRFLCALTPRAVGIHGTGILHKLFEITTTIADVVIQMPSASQADLFKRVEDVLFLKQFVFAFPQVQEAHKETLMQKIDQMMEKYPEIEHLESEVVMRHCQPLHHKSCT
jgi:hypothetical protein